MVKRVNKHNLALGVLALVIGIVLVVAASIPSLKPQPEELGQPLSTLPQPGSLATGLGGLPAFSNYDDLALFLNNVVKTRVGVRTYYDAVITPFLRTVGEEVSTTVTMPLSKEITSYGEEAGISPETKVSSTNVQVEGVDELDIVKTNGRIIVSAFNDKVYVVDAASKKVVSTLEIEEGAVKGVFLYNDKLVVVSENPIVVPLRLEVETRCRCLVVPPGTTNTTIYVYDITHPDKPKLFLKTSITGYVLASRLVNQYFYLVTRQPLLEPTVPMLDGKPLDPQYIVVADKNPDSYTNILVLDLSLRETTEKWSVQSFLTGPGSWFYMTPNRLYIAVQKYIRYDFMFKTALETIIKYLPSDLAKELSSIIESGEYWRASEKIAEYLSTLEKGKAEDIIKRVNTELSKQVFREKTKFYIFDVNGLKVVFKGSFEVPGRLLEQFSMEEYNGYFIVATTLAEETIKVSLVNPVIVPGTTTPTGEQEVRIIECTAGVCTEKTFKVQVKTPSTIRAKPWIIIDTTSSKSTNNVFIVEIDSLKIVGRLEGLAAGERIYAARLIKNIFYLVTYRRVDPLFAIDISNPENPVVLGYLKVPGFSEYLHPLTNNTLVGIGRGDNGLKISLFNITDPKNMSEISVIEIPVSHSPVLWDHHAFTIDRDSETFYIPVTIYQAKGYASGILVVSYYDNTLKTIKFLQHDGALRTLYIGNEVYTVSPASIKVFDSSNNYELLTEIPLAP